MAKAVKSAIKVFVVTFAVVTGLAALGVAFGVGTFTTFFGAKIVEIAAMSAVGVLVGGLMSKGVDAVGENFGSKISTRSATNPRQIIYGKARVGGTITHIETSGTDNHKLSMIVSLAGHELESLDEVLINDISVTSTSVGLFQYATNTKFKNTDNDNKFDSNGTLLRYKFIDGSQTTADSSVTANTSLTTSDKFIDVAYVFIEMVFDSEAFGGGIPPMSFVVKGKKVYDPRDSNQTFGTESTYTWSDNPALCVLDYITNTTYGLKATADEINTSTALGSFKVAANTCDFDGNTITTATVNGAVSGTQVTLDISNSITLIDVGQLVTGTGIVGTVKVASRDGNIIKLSSAQTIADGTTLTIKEKSYTANGITNMSADGGGVIEGLLSSCAGKLSYIDGKFVMFAGASVTPDMTITDDNLLAPITVQTRQTSGETFNQVKSVYIDANNNYVATDSPLETTTNPATSNTFLSEDTPTGEAQANYKKTLEVQLPFTDTTTMAQRLQRTALLHTRQKTALSVVCNIAYMQLQPFDWVYLTNERLGYTNKVFEVLSTNLEILEKDGVQVLATRLDLKEINNSVYNFASSSYTNPLDEGSSVSTGSFSVSPPTSLAVTTTLEITGHDLNVSWTNNPDDLVQGTEVFYGTSSGTYIGSFIVGKGTAKESINGVKASTTYYIAVRHFSANNVFSALTSEVTVTTGTAPISYSTGSGNVGGTDTINILGKNLVLNDFNSTTGGDNSANYTFLNSGNGALGGVTSYQNSDTERIQFEFGEDPDGDWGKDFFTFDFDWGLAKGGADGGSMGVGKFHIKGRAADNSFGNNWLENTIATFEVKNADGNVTTPFVTLANTTITGSTTTPIVEVSQGSAPSTTTNKLYNVGGTLYWNGAVVDTGAGDITGVTITTSGQSGLTGGASFASGDATFTLAIASTINGSKTFSDDVVVQGDLTVEGTTTTIDTTNLDVQDKNITLNYGSGDTSANANGAGITIQDAVSATQDATLTWNTANDSFNFSHNLNFADNVKAIFGTGSDLQIYHDGIHSFVKDAGTGNLKILADNLLLQRADQSQTYIQALTGGAVDLRYAGEAKLATSSSGINVTGTVVSDGLTVDGNTNLTGNFSITDNIPKITLEDSDTSTLASISANSSHLTYTTTSTARDHTFKQGTTTRMVIDDTGIDVTGTVTSDGLTNAGNISFTGDDRNLYFDSGTKVIGDHSVDGLQIRTNDTDPIVFKTNGNNKRFRIDGSGNFQVQTTTIIDQSRNLTNVNSIKLDDSKIAYFGTDNDMQIQHTGTVGQVRNYTGNLNLITDGTDADIIFQTDDGSGGLAEYLKIDGGDTQIKVSKTLKFYDDVQAWLGNSNDLRLYHNGTTSNSNIENYTGGLYITNYADDQDIIFRSDDGSGNVATYFQLDGSQAQLKVHKNMVFFDNVKASFGDGSDLQIYHDGNNSRITDQGNGSLILRGANSVEIEDVSGENMAVFTSNGASTLYYNNSPKIATTSSGIDVTGTVTADGLTVDGTAQINGTSAGQLTLDATGQYNQITFEQNSGNNSGGDIVYDHTNDQLWLRSLAVGSVHLKTGTTAGNTVDRLKVASNGDISFYEDTGSTAKFFWDASAERLAVGHSSPLATLDIDGDVYVRTGHTLFTDILRPYATTTLTIGQGTNDIAKFTGSIKIGNSTIVDSSRNLTNLGTISTSVAMGSSPTNIIYMAMSGNNTNGGGGAIRFDTSASNADSSLYYASVEGIRSSSGNGSNELHFFTTKQSVNNAAPTRKMTIDEDGNVGIGIDSFTNKLNVDFSITGEGSQEGGIKIQNSHGSNNDIAPLYFGVHGGTRRTKSAIGLKRTGSYGIGDLIFALDSNGDDANVTFSSDEKMRLNNSGNLLVGTTDTSVWNNGAGGNTGTVIESDGTIQLAKSNNITAYFNRLDSDGDIVSFRKNGSSVGSIGTMNFGDMYLGTDDTGIYFNNGIDSISPINTTNQTVRDNAIDLGASNARFKDLYLSGTISSGAITSTSSITANSGGNVIQIGTDGNIEITRTSGGAYIDFKDSSSEDYDQRLQATSSGHSFSGDVSVTNELNVGQLIYASGGITTDQSGQMISGFTTIRVGDALIGQDVATLTTTSASQTNRILASATTYRTLKVIVQIKSSTNFHATEILLTHNGTTVYMTEYATIFSNNLLATFDADISGGNIRLLIDPNQSVSTEFKFNVSGIEA